MGTVYRAYDHRLRRDVALKFLHASVDGHESARSLLREARTASAVSHPNICTVYEVGQDDHGSPYIAMEYVEGESLGPQLPPEVVIRYGVQIADALAHANARGIIHRDLKPANFIATVDGRVKVLDFGLARRPQATAAATTQSLGSAEPGNLCGTIPYMAPEVLRGGQPNKQSDLWALGVVLHQLATGSLPFHGQDAALTIAAILEGSADSVPASIGSELRATIGRLLARDPGKRYRSAGEVRAVLEGAQEGTRRDAPVPKTRRHQSRRLWLALAAVSLLALTGWFVAKYAGPARLRLRDHSLVSTFAASHDSPSFSSDARWVAFVAPDAAGVGQIWIRNLDQGDPNQITFGNVAAERPRWSPAGSQILFNRVREGIWSVPPLGGAPTRIVEQGLNANFSADGERIVYERQGRIGISNADGSNARVLDRIPAKYYSVPAYPAWSPDGRSIAYSGPKPVRTAISGLQTWQGASRGA